MYGSFLRKKTIIWATLEGKQILKLDSQKYKEKKLNWSLIACVFSKESKLYDFEEKKKYSITISSLATSDKNASGQIS